jgi:hypothetical protein
MIVDKMNDLPGKVAKIISVLFHPLFMPLYGMLIIFLPSAPYGYLPYGVKKLLLLIIAVNNVFLPLSLLPVLRQMNFISSLSLDERKERKVPLLVTTILYAATTYMMFRFPVPFFLKSFIFSAFMISLVITISPSFLKSTLPVFTISSPKSIRTALPFFWYSSFKEPS